MGKNRRTGKRRTKIPGVEKAGLENAGTSCVWVAKHNVINVRVFLKAVCHSMGAHSSCDPYAEPTDSDSDSPDDEAGADAGAATVNATAANATDDCEVCLVDWQCCSNLAWCWCHAAISDFANHVFGTLKVSEVGVLSVVRTSPWYFVFF